MSTTKRTRNWVMVAILFAAVAVYLGIRQYHKNKDEVYVEVKPVHGEQGWGYNILTDGKVYIHQEYIPAVPGKQGFRSEEDALKVGRKVVSRLSEGGLPSITVADLKELGIVYDSLAAR